VIFAARVGRALRLDPVDVMGRDLPERLLLAAAAKVLHDDDEHAASQAKTAAARKPKGR